MAGESPCLHMDPSHNGIVMSLRLAFKILFFHMQRSLDSAGDRYPFASCMKGIRLAGEAAFSPFFVHFRLLHSVSLMYTVSSEHYSTKAVVEYQTSRGPLFMIGT